MYYVVQKKVVYRIDTDDITIANQKVFEAIQEGKMHRCYHSNIMTKKGLDTYCAKHDIYCPPVRTI